MGLVQDIKCKSCGGPLAIKAGEVIITCEYCGSSINVASGKSFFLAHSIIPNNHDEASMRGLIKRWMSDGALKPSNMVAASKITDLACVFLPFYIVHTNVTTKYRGYYTRGGGREDRKGNLQREYFWKVLGRRGSKFPTKEYEIPLKGKTNFNLSKIPGYAKYLNAEFDERDAKDMTKMELQDHQKFLLSDQVDEFAEINHNFKIADVEFVHAPVWRIDYTYTNKDYQILMDGSSGSVIRGDIPPPDHSMGGFFSDMKKAMFGR